MTTLHQAVDHTTLPELQTLPANPWSVAISNTEPTPLSETPSPCRSVFVQGHPANNGAIKVGAAGTDNQEVSLDASQYFFFPINDASRLYAIADNNGEQLVCWKF
jgi:hypothetical protein